VSAKLETLNREVSDIADRLTVLVSLETRSAQDDTELDALATRSETVREEIKREETISAKVAELRAVADRCTPAQTETRAMSSDITPIDYGNARNLKAFTGERAQERAYRAGQWYLGTLFGDENAKRWCVEHGVESRLQSVGDAGLGGNLTVPEVLSTVIELVNEYGVFPSVVNQIPMGSETLSVPRRVGGLTAYFMDEAAAATDSSASWDRVQLVAKKLGVANRLSSEVIQDSIISIADKITLEIGRAFAYKIDSVIANGQGNAGDGLITGIVTKLTGGTANASLVVAPAGEVGFDTLSLETFINVVGTLPLFARQSAAWYLSPAGYAQSMQRLMLASGGSRPSDIAGKSEASFLGFPVRLSNTLDSQLGDDPATVKVLFGDLSLSTMMGTRRAMSMRVSDQRYIELDEVVMLANTRIAVTVHDVGTNSVVGPVLALKTHA